MRASLVCLGGLVLDEVLLVERIPGPGEDLPARAGPLGPGGSATNVARLAAALGLPTALVVRVGADDLGERLVREVRRGGVRVHRQRDARRPTGRTIALVEPGGARRFLTLRGAEVALAFDATVERAVAGTGWLFVSGYELEGPGARTLVRAVRRTSRTVVFDPAPVVGRLRARALEAVCRAARVVVGTREELAAIRALGLMPSAWVEKRGPRGAVASGALGSAHVPASRPPHGRVVDTTGAGDAFAAGLLVGLARGLPLESSLRLASACGAAAVCGAGADHALVHVERLRARLEGGRR